MNQCFFRSLILAGSGILLSAVAAWSQPALFNNEGAVVYTGPNAIVKVKGSMVNDTNSVFTNHGTTTIDTSYTNNAYTDGKGIYNVGLHWINNGTFVRDTSQVILTGDNQLITGDSITHFYTLELTGTGIKRQTLDAFVHAFLRLNDRELATDSFLMTVENNMLTAITRTSGFVSSLGPGRLVRQTLVANQPYLFPTGSSLVPGRYRPVEIRQPGVAIQYFAVSLVNHDPTTDGRDVNDKDSAVCQVNPQFYHYINHPVGGGNADVSIYYDPAVDGDWDALAYWSTALNPEWEDMGQVTNNTAPPLNYNTRNAWSGWVNEAYALSKKRPSIPLITGETTVCGGYTTLYTGSAPETNTTYTWNVTSGGMLGADSSINPMPVIWGSGNTQDTLSLIQTAPNGCASYPAQLIIQVTPQPVAGFTASPLVALGSVPIVYTDSSQNAAYWYWYFGDGQTSNAVNPEHIFNQEGAYTTMLVIETAEGCLDTAYIIVTIIDGLHIPNVFTPNGDGSNDFFEINGSNFQRFESVIYNRWGELMFESDAAQLSWDGRTPTGTAASAGTYFLVLNITLLNGQQVKYTSHFNLFY